MRSLRCRSVAGVVVWCECVELAGVAFVFLSQSSSSGITRMPESAFCFMVDDTGEVMPLGFAASTNSSFTVFHSFNAFSRLRPSEGACSRPNES